MKQADIDLFYLTEAYRVATTSLDNSLQNGAILVRDNKSFSIDNIIGSAANNFPEGVRKEISRFERPDKYDFTDHAETGAIYDAASKGNSTKDSTMYCPWFACVSCGRGIIRSGIKEVIGYGGIEVMQEKVSEIQDDRIDWKATIQKALSMFDEAGVKYRWVDGNIKEDIEILFTGKKFRLNSLFDF